MGKRRRLTPEAKLLIREYGLRVARKKHPEALIDVQVGDYVDENGRVERTVTITPDPREI
jgi:hypothetical protein